MDRDEINSRLDDARSATLGTVDELGRPHLVPIVFAYEDGRLYTAVDLKPKSTLRLKRLRNIEGNPNVCVLVDHYDDDWSRLWWVRLDGTARVVRSGPELRKSLALLTAKYEVYTAQPPPGPAIVVRMDNLRAWSAMPSMSEWRERMAGRPETDLGVDAATLIAEERSRRTQEILSRHLQGHEPRGDRTGDDEGAGLR